MGIEPVYSGKATSALKFQVSSRLHFFIFIYVHEGFAYMFVCSPHSTCMPSPHGDHKRASDLLELELQMDMNDHLVWKLNLSPLREQQKQQKLLTAERISGPSTF